jgi:hypothetical protein
MNAFLSLLGRVSSRVLGNFRAYRNRIKERERERKEDEGEECTFEEIDDQKREKEGMRT